MPGSAWLQRGSPFPSFPSRQGRRVGCGEQRGNEFLSSFSCQGELWRWWLLGFEAINAGSASRLPGLGVFVFGAEEGAAARMPLFAACLPSGSVSHLKKILSTYDFVA